MTGMLDWAGFTAKRMPGPKKARLELECLEAREVPAGISGYAFNDLNGNGLRDPGELPIANSTIRLLDSSNRQIGTTTTDANGFYRFLTDQSLAPSQQTISQTLQFGDGPTNAAITRALAAFNPDLGTLLRIDISIQGRITSQIRAENLDPAAAAIQGNVVGTVLLGGPGISLSTSTGTETQTHQATSYDGSTDFAGGSGVTFAVRTATGSNSLVVTDAATLAGFVGSGNVNLTVTPQAASNASGGGNLVAQINSTGGAEVIVTYTYIGSNALRPGAYQVEQPISPPDLLDGRLSRNGELLPWTSGARRIAVNYNGQTEAANNNFASLQAGSISGTVYLDANNDAQHQPVEVGIGGVRITLTGTNDKGQAVNLTQQTNGDGFYQFTDLRPGTYIVTQSRPTGFLDGRINAPGSLGGTAEATRFTQVEIGSGSAGVGYNFAWLKSASLSGFIYFDRNKDGVFNAGDRGIKKLQVTLTGVNDLGQTVNLTARSDASGFYQFTGLRPGDYTVTQTQTPGGWRRGAVNVGSAGGIQATNATTDIFLAMGDLGRDYNFAFQQVGSSKANLLGSTWRRR